MKQVMMVKFDSPKWRKVDEYKVANPFVDVGFRQVKDVVDLRVFDLLNISRINNNRAEEMLLCIYHLLQPDRRIDEGIYNDEIDQYFSYREWKKKHQPLSGVTVREILATEDLNEDALLRIFDGVTAAFYKSDEYNSREYRYSNLSELRKAMKHKGAARMGKPSKDYAVPLWEKANLTVYEAAAYSGIGADKLRELSDREDCEFVLWNGTKRLIKRKKLDEFLERAYSI